MLIWQKRSNQLNFGEIFHFRISCLVLERVQCAIDLTAAKVKTLDRYFQKMTSLEVVNLKIKRQEMTFFYAHLEVVRQTTDWKLHHSQGAESKE